MVWQPTARKEWYRLGIIALAVTTIGLAVFIAGATSPAAGQTDLSVQNLTVDGVNKTLQGNVTGATVETTLNYDIDVADANRRVVRLKVGPTANDTTTLDFSNRDITGSTSGTVTLSGDLFAHEDLNASALTPGYGATKTTDVVVIAEITVSTSDGDTIETVVERPVEITLSDEGGPRARLGGTGNISVQTDA